MPHFRIRIARELVENSLKHSPLVGVFGHRQAGKTTLVSNMCQAYYSLDDERTFLMVDYSPKDFLKDVYGPLVAIDECQQIPALFPALKELVRTKPTPGKFLLSGSVRFTSRKAIRESLTGRILQVELLPLTYSELHQLEEPENIKRLTLLEQFSQTQTEAPLKDKEFKKTALNIQNYIQNGGLPGTCFIRNEKTRKQKVLAQLETILDRDVRLVYPTTLSYPIIKRLFELLSQNHTEIFKFSDLKKETGLSIQSIHKLIYAFESVFLIRPILVEGDTPQNVYFFEDPSELNALRNTIPQPQEDISYLCFLAARAQFHYDISEPYTLFQYRTRGGIKIPVALKYKNKVVGFIATEKETPNRKEKASAAGFLKKYGNSKIIYVTSNNIGAQLINSREIICSTAYLIK